MFVVTLLLLEKFHVELSNSVVLLLLLGDELAFSLFLILGITLNPILQEILCVVSLFEGIKFIIQKGKAYWMKRFGKDRHSAERRDQ